MLLLACRSYFRYFRFSSANLTSEGIVLYFKGDQWGPDQWSWFGKVAGGVSMALGGLICCITFCCTLRYGVKIQKERSPAPPPQIQVPPQMRAQPQMQSPRPPPQQPDYREEEEDLVDIQVDDLSAAEVNRALNDYRKAKQQQAYRNQMNQ